MSVCEFACLSASDEHFMSILATYESEIGFYIIHLMNESVHTSGISNRVILK